MIISTKRACLPCQVWPCGSVVVVVADDHVAFLVHVLVAQVPRPLVLHKQPRKELLRWNTVTTVITVRETQIALSRPHQASTRTRLGPACRQRAALSLEQCFAASPLVLSRPRALNDVVVEQSAVQVVVM